MVSRATFAGMNGAPDGATPGPTEGVGATDGVGPSGALADGEAVGAAELVADRLGTTLVSGLRPAPNAMTPSSATVSAARTAAQANREVACEAKPGRTMKG